MFVASKKRSLQNLVRAVLLSWALVGSIAATAAFAQVQQAICNEGGNWQQVAAVTTQQHAGFISCVYSPPTDSNTIFAGSHSGGLWKTTDMGQHWRCVTDGLRLPGLGINSIVAHPSNAQLMYAATGTYVGTYQNFGTGVIQSTDGGETWQPSGLQWSAFYGDVCLRLLIDPNQSNTLYALTAQKLYKSTDAARTWSVVLERSKGAKDGFYDLRFAQQASYLVVATRTPTGDYPTGAHIFVSADSGQSFSDISPQIHNTPTAKGYGWLTNRYYVATSGSRIYTIFKDYNAQYTLQGMPFLVYDLAQTQPTWSILSPNAGGTSLDGHEAVFEVSPANPDVMYTGKIRLTKSINGGKIFTNAYQQLHIDVRALQIYRATPNSQQDVLIVGNDGGVGRSNDGGRTWTNLNGTELIVTEFFDIATTSFKKDWVAGGTQDNGYLKYENGYTIHQGTGDGGSTIADWSNADRVLLKDNSGTGLLCLSTDGGNTIGSIVQTVRVGLNFDNFLIAQHPQQPQLLYMAKDNTIEIIDSTLPDSQNAVFSYRFEPSQSVSIDQKTQTMQSFDVRAMAVAPSDGNVLYVAGTLKYGQQWTSINALFESTDGGKTWQLTANTYYPINTIAVADRQPQHVWVGFAGMDKGNDPSGQTGSHRVAYSSKGGRDLNDDLSAANGLPFVAVNALLYVRGSTDVLFAATDAGIYRYHPNSNRWSCYSYQLPSATVSDLEINYCTQQLYAATFGRGIWRSALPAPDNDLVQTISQHTTLPPNSITHAAYNIHITPNSTLNIQGTLYMAANTRIIIEQGGRLLLDGGTVANACGDEWQGIENRNRTKTGIKKSLVIGRGAAIKNLADQ